MSAPVMTVTPNDNLAHVRNMMIKFKIGRLVVVDGGQVVGIVTWTDLIKALLSREKKWAYQPVDEILVKEVMGSSPLMIRISKSVRLAAKAMVRRDISGLPVLDQKDELKGIITKTDIVRAIPQTRSASLPVSKVMVSPVVTATPYHTVYRAASLMAEHGIAHLVIEEGGSPVGIIAKSDLASFAPLVSWNSHPSFIKLKHTRAGAPHPARLYQVPIAADLMTVNMVVTRPDATLMEASQFMLRRGISCLPVVSEEDLLIGMLTKSDLVRAVAKYR